MAVYFAEAIIEGRLDYQAIFAISVYKRYKADVDAILAA